MTWQTSLTAIFAPAIAALFALVVAMGRAIIAYLRDENKELKTERAGVLATLVEVTKTQEASIAATGEYVRTLKQQQDYEQRVRAEKRDGP